MSVLTKFLNWLYGTTPSAPAPANKVSSGATAVTAKPKRAAKKSAPKKKTTKKASHK